jgi:hypothetical protein
MSYIADRSLWAAGVALGWQVGNVITNTSKDIVAFAIMMLALSFVCFSVNIIDKRLGQPRIHWRLERDA